MPKPRGHARQLFESGMQSLQLAVEQYNRPSEVGRGHVSVILLQHALEMLLKASIRAKKGKIRDAGEKYNYGFGRCINIAESELLILTPTEAPELRVLEGHRDAAMHDVLQIPEELLYYVVHSGVAAARSILRKAFDLDLSSYLPPRALPVSAEMPPDLAVVLQSTFETARSLLKTGLRRGSEAKGLLGAIAAIEAAVSGGSGVRTDDQQLESMLRRIRMGEDLDRLFPSVAALVRASPDSPAPAGSIYVNVALGSHGLPVRYAEEGETASIVREVNCFDQYPFSSVKLGEKLGETGPRARSLLWHLGLIGDRVYHSKCRTAGGGLVDRYSVAAFRLIRDQLATLDKDAIWKAYRAAGGH